MQNHFSIVESYKNIKVKRLDKRWWQHFDMEWNAGEPVKNGLARVVMGLWLFAILVVMAGFTASLTTMLTLSWSKPSVLNVATLKKTNAPVGCNSESFIYNYLKNTLKFEPSKITKMKTIDDYPEAFKSGTIQAAFLISPHAEIFLAKYCRGYTKALSTFKLAGIGFVSALFLICVSIL